MPIGLRSTPRRVRGESRSSAVARNCSFACACSTGRAWSAQRQGSPARSPMFTRPTARAGALARVRSAGRHRGRRGTDAQERLVQAAATIVSNTDLGRAVRRLRRARRVTKASPFAEAHGRSRDQRPARRRVREPGKLHERCRPPIPNTPAAPAPDAQNRAGPFIPATHHRVGGQTAQRPCSRPDSIPSDG